MARLSNPLLSACSIVEPFRIICETCRSRLKIRSSEVIGEIHACPKCGSMVHIQPPAGWSAEAAPQAHGQLSTPGAALTFSATESAIIPASVAFALPAELATPEAVAAAAPVPL